MSTSSPAVPVIVGVAQLALPFFLPLPRRLWSPSSSRWPSCSPGRRPRGLATLAVFDSVPSFFVLTTIVTAPWSPTFTWPRSHVTLSPAFVAGPARRRDEVHRRAGRLSVTTTLVAGPVDAVRVRDPDRVRQVVAGNDRIRAVRLRDRQIGVARRSPRTARVARSLEHECPDTPGDTAEESRRTPTLFCASLRICFPP